MRALCLFNLFWNGTPFRRVLVKIYMFSWPEVKQWHLWLKCVIVHFLLSYAKRLIVILISDIYCYLSYSVPALLAKNAVLRCFGDLRSNTNIYCWTVELCMLYWHLVFAMRSLTTMCYCFWHVSGGSTCRQNGQLPLPNEISVGKRIFLPLPKRWPDHWGIIWVEDNISASCIGVYLSGRCFTYWMLGLLREAV